MKFDNKYFLLSTRAFTLATGFSANLLVANLIIANQGRVQYGIFIAVITVPALFPFLDMGIGLTILNHFSEKHFGDKRRHKSEMAYSSFVLSTIFSFIFGIIILTLLYYTDLFGLLSSLRTLSLNMSVVFIIVITLASVPFSLGFKLLHALQRDFEAIVISAIVPIFTVICAYCGVYRNGFEKGWAYVIPSIGYLISCVIAFIRSGYYEHLFKNGIKLSESRNHYRLILTSGAWFTSFTSLLILSVHLPKFFFLRSGNSEMLTQYALVLIFFGPLSSLLQVIFNSMSVKARILSSKQEQLNLARGEFKLSIVITFFAVIVFGTGSFYLSKLGLNFPKLEYIAFLGLMMIAWSCTSVPFLLFRSLHALKSVSSFSLMAFATSIFVTFLAIEKGFSAYALISLVMFMFVTAIYNWQLLRHES